MATLCRSADVAGEQRPWWRTYPDRWARELASLTEHGATVTVPEDADERALRTLEVRWPLPERTVNLQVTYPVSYPWFPVQVVGPELVDCHRHRHPLTGVLCLVSGREDWSPELTAAELIATQLPRLLAANAATTTADARGLEVAGAEPVAAYFEATVEGAALVDSAWVLPDHARGGGLLIGIETLRGSRNNLFAVLELRRHNGRCVLGVDPEMRRRYPHTLTGHWVALDHVPTVGESPESLWLQGTAQLPEQYRPSGEGVGAEIVGLAFPDESGHRTTGLSWLFLARHRLDPRRGWKTDVIRAQNAGPGDVGLRTPETTGLRRRHVVLLGAGSLGSTIALDLARAGVGRMTIVDGDVVEAATACRQSPYHYAGIAKAFAVADNASRYNLRCQLQTYPGMVGSITDQGVLPHLLGDADLVIDAAANVALTRYLAAQAITSHTPVVVAAATAGGWGGSVVRLPGLGRACWFCLEHHRADKTVPWPPASPTGTVLPAGCSSPTFTGSGFDLAEVAHHAVRVTVSALSVDEPGGYPHLPDDLYVLSLRDGSGRPHAPHWQSLPLVPHPACPHHHAATPYASAWGVEISPKPRLLAHLGAKRPPVAARNGTGHGGAAATAAEVADP